MKAIETHIGDDCGKVRCGVSVSRCVAAVPVAAAAGESDIGIGEWEWGGGERVSWAGTSAERINPPLEL